ncbi:MAG: hypothetical protein KIT44_02740 [Opitutaceae bacterium]|nr:hypothetical protein [Opitutaceae bacterium]
MLNYTYTQSRQTLTVKAGATIEVRSVLNWTSAKPNEKALAVFIDVEGAVKHKDRTWIEKWSFNIKPEEVVQLEAALLQIRQHVDQRMVRQSFRAEVFADITPWLRVGWIDENGGWKGYARFKQGEHCLVSEFTNVDTLSALRDYLRRVLPPG